MNTRGSLCCWTLLTLCFLFGVRGLGASEQTEDSPDRPRRVPWTASRVKGRPDPPLPYRAELAFGNLEFTQPVTITGAPSTTRLFVVEVTGKVFSFPEDAHLRRVYTPG